MLNRRISLFFCCHVLNLYSSMILCARYPPTSGFTPMDCITQSKKSREERVWSPSRRRRRTLCARDDHRIEASPQQCEFCSSPIAAEVYALESNANANRSWNVVHSRLIMVEP